MFVTDAPASATLDMAITRAEFVRQLAQAFGPQQSPLSQHADTFTGSHAGCRWRITLQAVAPTRLGLIVLERWSAKIELDAANAAQRASWWRQFTVHFQKGGG